MKTIFKLMTTVSFMLLAFVAVANDIEPKLVFETKEEAKTMVFELESPAKEASIQFVDGKGNTLFIEDIEQKTGYIKKFNLKNLTEGEYQLTTENTQRSIVYKISVEDGNARLISKKVIAKPIYRVNSNKVSLSIPANGNKKVTVSIYNAAGELVQEERFKNPTTSIKVFNFEGSDKGDYSIRVWNANGKYLETFEVK